MEKTRQEIMLLFSNLSAGVGCLIISCFLSFMSKSFGSTSKILSSSGCIALLINGRVNKSMPTITRLNVEKIVAPVEMTAVTLLFVAIMRSSPPVASFRGIEPEMPPCQTRKPE